MIKKIAHILLACLIILFLQNCTLDNKSDSGKEVVLRLEPSNGNPRNSEGDFIQLNDSRILFVYTHFTEGTGDNAGAYLAGRYSSDGGKTWANNDVVVLSNEGVMNIMSVSLIRLNDGRIALFYLRKNSDSDCIPMMRISDDEAKTWSDAKECITDIPGYYVMNNDRVVKLKSGRILLPVALHRTPNDEGSSIGRIMCYFSDDEGKTWRRSKDAANPDNAITQEPGIVELKDGKLMLFCRTESGTQFISHSSDLGESWSTLKHSSIKSPLSPASIERIPQTGDLMLVWNNNYKPILDGGNRTPYNLAISKDEGKTWEKIKPIESNPNGWYCYTAIDFVGDHILLGHCAGDRTKNVGLATTQITRLSLDWIYKEATSTPTLITDSMGIVKLDCTDKDAKIYYSLERKMPNILYSSPLKISRITPLWAQAIAAGKTESELFKTYVGNDLLQPSLEIPIKKGKGLIYKYYEGIVSTVLKIPKLSIKNQGVAGSFNIDNRQRDTNFAFIFNGYIKIPVDGRYTFYLASNDGSVLDIDDHELINHDGPHAMTEESNMVSLQKGSHKISIQYFQMMGGQGLKLSWMGPGFKKVEVQNSVLFH